MKKKKAYGYSKPNQITRGEHANAALYSEALKVLPNLIRKLAAQGRIKFASPLTEVQQEQIRRGLNKYGRKNEKGAGAGAVSMV